MSDAGITVAGRVFRPVTSRSDGKVLASQYNYLMAHIWAANPDGVAEESLPRLVARIARADVSAEILAGLYVAETDGQPEPWSVANANRNAKHFAQPHTFDDNATLQHALMQGLADFFPGALDSTESTDPASASPATPASISGDPTTSSATPSASSDPSSALSLDTTLTSSTA
jgi:hypothetical protein